MSSELFYVVSLIAAFIAGMVALFVPCCISYLLPAYLGSVFKEKKRIILMTVIYSLGIGIVMLPVVLGAQALRSFFFNWHDQTYLIGGGLMIVIGILAFLGIKTPMPKWLYRQSQGQNPDIGSIFSLGIVSGITSSCCAPVLIGVLTLSGLSPTPLKALGIGATYVLGMVAPLYLAAAVIDKKNFLEKPVFKKRITTIKLGSQEYPILVTNIVATGIFLGMGIIILVMTVSGKLAMPRTEAGITQLIQNTALTITNWLTK